jgi:DNA replication ATP-dependent helicase Dna2
MLSLKDERTGLMYVVHLRQSWYESRCTKKSYVHIVGDFNQYGECIIDDADNMIILHPDHLISATVVGDSFTCTRRAALQDRVKATSRATAPQVYGHIIHELFGEALRLNVWSTESLLELIQRILPNYLEALYEIGVSVNDATEYLLGKTPDLIGWANVFVSDHIVPDSVIRDRNGSLVSTAINKLLELEEHVWSPIYGLKGNIDATVQAQMQLPEDGLSKTLVVPLELKTGKRDNVETHRAQTALYTLLLSDRYDVNVTCGILYYLETSKTFRIESVRNEIRHLIIERNELACYVHEKLALPPMLKKQHLCKACYSKTECFTYHRLVEGGDAETSGMGETFNEMMNHLKPSHAEFFKKWDNLLTKEERDTMKFRRELWTMLSTERQGVGRCFANVVIEPGSAQENRQSTKINRFSYAFVKQKAKAGFSFTESQITVGEPIVISDEQGHFNLASGYVTNVRPTRIVVAVDRRLHNSHHKHPDFDPVNNQVFTGLMEVSPDGTSSSAPDYQPRVYRIDRDEFANGMATARNNLIRIMEKHLFKARELRQLIVEGKAPKFKVGAPSYTLSGPASQQSLNDDQHRAIDQVMTAKDYALVLGMPGTGKTTTIAHIIRALVSQGKSVLLASYTHSAVDNILLKIKDDNIPILRIGAVSKVHPVIQTFADLAGVPKKTMEELHQSWHESKVIATTCLGINHAIFNARTFDYCIVDEASQITLPVCLGPIRHAKTFILVGDHYQLPPLVQNKEAQEGGLNVSLFKLLSDAHPESVVNLEHQYRMAEDIMTLSSRLVYNDRLKCGNSIVSQRTLTVPDLEAGLAAHHHNSSSLPASNTEICLNGSSCFLHHSISPSTRLTFLNTDHLGPLAAETLSGNGNRITNTLESTLTAQLATTLIRSGINPRDIGVITFYRSQLALLKRDIKSHAGSNASSEIEINTADKYQGRDKEVVVLSFVRSNPSRQVGELLKDWRRVNVALTRARSKLVIVGSRETIGGSDVPVLKGMVGILAEKRWVFDLPASAVGGHRFECVGTQTQRTQRERSAAASPKKRSGPEVLGVRNVNIASSVRQVGGVKKGMHGTYHNKAFKTPKKMVDGKVAQVNRMLDRAEMDGGSVLRDVVNENLAMQVDGAGAENEFDAGIDGEIEDVLNSLGVDV